MSTRELSERKKYEKLRSEKTKERKERCIEQEEKTRKEVEERNSKYNNFVVKMEKAYWESGLSMRILAGFMGITEESLRDFFKNKKRTKRVYYKYAYILCLAFSKTYLEAMEDLKESGNPIKNVEKEDDLLATLDFIISKNMSVIDRLTKASDYISLDDIKL